VRLIGKVVVFGTPEGPPTGKLASRSEEKLLHGLPGGERLIRLGEVNIHPSFLEESSKCTLMPGVVRGRQLGAEGSQ